MKILHMGSWTDYVRVARPNHWFKNVFMLFGTAIACVFERTDFDAVLLWHTALAFACACLTASFNYMVNEVVDAPFDRLHPTKRERPVAAGRVQPGPIIACACLLLLSSLGIAYKVLGRSTTASLCLLAGLGLLYNLRPFRLKERPLIDVISESANNPARLFIGWYAAGAIGFPPSSLVLAYWTIGAFLMTAKRYAELRFIGDKEKAASYRRSFAWYSEKKLLLLMIMYVGVTLFLCGVLSAKYHPELILAVPFVCVFVGWFFYLALERDSVVKEPEKIARRPLFVAYCALLVALLAYLSSVHLPWIERLLGIEGQPW